MTVQAAHRRSETIAETLHLSLRQVSPQRSVPHPPSPAMLKPMTASLVPDSPSKQIRRLRIELKGVNKKFDDLVVLHRKEIARAERERKRWREHRLILQLATQGDNGEAKIVRLALRAARDKVRGGKDEDEDDEFFAGSNEEEEERKERVKQSEGARGGHIPNEMASHRQAPSSVSTQKTLAISHPPSVLSSMTRSSPKKMEARQSPTKAMTGLTSSEPWPLSPSPKKRKIAETASKGSHASPRKQSVSDKQALQSSPSTRSRVLRSIDVNQLSSPQRSHPTQSNKSKQPEARLPSSASRTPKNSQLRPYGVDDPPQTNSSELYGWAMAEAQRSPLLSQPGPKETQTFYPPSEFDIESHEYKQGVSAEVIITDPPELRDSNINLPTSPGHPSRSPPISSNNLPHLFPLTQRDSQAPPPDLEVMDESYPLKQSTARRARLFRPTATEQSIEEDTTSGSTTASVAAERKSMTEGSAKRDANIAIPDRKQGPTSGIEGKAASGSRPSRQLLSQQTPLRARRTISLKDSIEPEGSAEHPDVSPHKRAIKQTARASLSPSPVKRNHQLLQQGTNVDHNAPMRAKERSSTSSGRMGLETTLPLNRSPKQTVLAQGIVQDSVSTDADLSAPALVPVRKATYAASQLPGTMLGSTQPKHISEERIATPTGPFRNTIKRKLPAKRKHEDLEDIVSHLQTEERSIDGGTAKAAVGGILKDLVQSASVAHNKGSNPLSAAVLASDRASSGGEPESNDTPASKTQNNWLNPSSSRKKRQKRTNEPPQTGQEAANGTRSAMYGSKTGMSATVKRIAQLQAEEPGPSPSSRSSDAEGEDTPSRSLTSREPAPSTGKDSPIERRQRLASPLLAGEVKAGKAPSRASSPSTGSSTSSRPKKRRLAGGVQLADDIEEDLDIVANAILQESRPQTDDEGESIAPPQKKRKVNVDVQLTKAERRRQMGMKNAPTNNSTNKAEIQPSACPPIRVKKEAYTPAAAAAATATIENALPEASTSDLSRFKFEPSSAKGEMKANGAKQEEKIDCAQEGEEEYAGQRFIRDIQRRRKAEMEADPMRWKRRPAPRGTPE